MLNNHARGTVIICLRQLEGNMRLVDMKICSWSWFPLLLLKIPLIIFTLFIEVLPSFLQKVEVVAEASRETYGALSDCLHLFTKQEGVGLWN